MISTAILPAESSIPICEAALADLGAGPGALDANAVAALDRDGYLVVERRLDDVRLDELRALHDRLIARKYADPTRAIDGREDYWHHENGTLRLADLLNEGEPFERIARDPVLLAATHRLMGDPFKHDSINSRTALPGRGEQRLHRDGPLRPDGRTECVNSAWLLDAFTPSNGPTRVLPGTHRVPDGDPPAVDERALLAPAGSMIVFSGTLWHSGTRNDTDQPRRVVHVSFRRRDVDLGERAQRQRIRKAVYDRASPAMRWLLDV